MKAKKMMLAVCAVILSVSLMAAQTPAKKETKSEPAKKECCEKKEAKDKAKKKDCCKSETAEKKDCCKSGSKSKKK